MQNEVGSILHDCFLLNLTPYNRYRGGLPHTRYHTKGTGDGSEDGDEKFENFFPVDFHSGLGLRVMGYRLKVMGYRLKVKGYGL